MPSDKDTVELPANAELKQLAHDVVREDKEEVVPLILDFYDFVSTFDETDHARYSDFDVDSPESEASGAIWRMLLDELAEQDIIEKHHGNKTTFTWKD